MKPTRHLVVSAAFSAALAPWLRWRALLVLVGGVLVDLDRYLWYAARHRTLRLNKAMEEFQGRDRIRDDPRFLHSVEFLVLLALASYWFPLVRLVALGVVLHLALDLTVYKTQGRFWFRFQHSQLRCLALDWLRRRRAGESMSDASIADVEEGE